MNDSQFLAITIHNNSIGRISSHNTWEDAVNELRARAEITMQRELTSEEFSLLENDGSFYDESDADNYYSWEIGIIGEGVIEENAREIAEKQSVEKEYVFKHNSKDYYISCRAYSLELAAKSPRLGPGWYLFSIDGERV